MVLGPFNLLLWVPVAVISVLGNSVDIFLLLSFGIKKNCHILKELLTAHADIELVIDIAKISVSIFTLLQFLQYIRALKEPLTGIDGFLAKPMLFPCRTAHTRLFPTKHSFSYSYLLVGIPVGWRGSTGGMVSGEISTAALPWYLRVFPFRPANAWFTVNGDDYLARGHAAGGLREKLEVFLHSQNEDPKKYPHAYLLTAPRFLNYSSNPVSIWHLYSARKVLSAIVLEVNNTFDERHSYFLKLDDVVSSQADSPAAESTGASRFTRTWPKDFYVSVFNSRAGAYSISASDPLSPYLTGPGDVNTTITLSSSKGHPKLIARIYSTSTALDPTDMSVAQKVSFLANWWWVGFATFPRTIKEAVNILWRKRLHWVFRPEPRTNTMPRKADDFETFIEPIFREHLRSAVEKSEEPLVLKYIPAGLLDVSEELMTSPSTQLVEATNIKELEIRVLTPVFYSRFVRYSQTLDSLTSECFQSATISISDAETLNAIDFSPRSSQSVGSLSRIQLSLLQGLRKRPLPIENTESKKLNAKRQLIFGKVSILSNSELDAFAASQFSSTLLRVYTTNIMKMFIAERIALGWVELLYLEIFICRVVAAWILASKIHVHTP